MTDQWAARFQRYRELIRIIDRPERWIAKAVNASQKTVYNWQHGHQVPPPEIMAWLERYAIFRERYPPPDFQKVTSRPRDIDPDQ
jgi:predicted RNA-binding protein